MYYYIVRSSQNLLLVVPTLVIQKKWAIGDEVYNSVGLGIFKVVAGPVDIDYVDYWLKLEQKKQVRGNETPGSLLKKARKEAGLSQVELSKLVGVNPAAINLIENDKSDGKINTWAGIAQVLHKSIDYFLDVE